MPRTYLFAIVGFAVLSARIGAQAADTTKQIMQAPVVSQCEARQRAIRTPDGQDTTELGSMMLACFEPSPVTPDLKPREQAKANALLLELWEEPDGLWDYAKVRSVTVAQVRMAVNDGADVNTKDKDGWTALMIAAEWSSMACVKYLVGKGADVNTKDKDGWTALIHAARRPSWRLPSGTNLLCVKYLVSKGADVNAKAKDGWTALWEAADSGDVACVQYLVGKGADVNVKDKDGWTTLMRAAGSDDLACVKYLVERGVDVNAKDNDFGMTALSIARTRSSADIVAYLKAHGATK